MVIKNLSPMIRMIVISVGLKNQELGLFLSFFANDRYFHEKNKNSLFLSALISTGEC